MVNIVKIHFHNFKALKSYTLNLKNTNILVGPNNCGKSTIISAFRILEVALRTANSKSATHIPNNELHSSIGHAISEENLPVPLENVHTDYSNEDSFIEFHFENGNQLFLYFPKDSGCFLTWNSQGQPTRTPSLFRKQFPLKVQVIPVLGPLEQEENIVTDETVRKSLGTPRASRHFRNYWYKNPEEFGEFRKMVLETWPGMNLHPPTLAGGLSNRLVMFCSEKRIDREIFWAGSGFQIWCQLLTHVFRSHKYDFTIIDEPEIYLHPDVQRQFLSILRDVSTNVVLATHSTEIIGEADPAEILLIDKEKRKSKRLQDAQGVQEALLALGSAQNITLTHLARTRKILFVEGLNDYKLIRRFARLMKLQKLSSGSDITAFESGGFSSWQEISSFSKRIAQTHNETIKISAVYDRDYKCDAEINEIKKAIKKHLMFVHFHEKKEIENYLLVPNILDRVLKKHIVSLEESSADILNNLTSLKKIKIQSQYVSKYLEYHKSKGSKKDQASLSEEAMETFEQKWEKLIDRLNIIPGKVILKEFRSYIASEYKFTLTDVKIIDEFKNHEIPNDLKNLLNDLEKFRKL